MLTSKIYIKVIRACTAAWSGHTVGVTRCIPCIGTLYALAASMMCLGGLFMRKNKKRDDDIESLPYGASDSVVDMMEMISVLQSERMDSQRAELRPLKKTKEAKATSLPGLRPMLTSSTRPEEDFLDMIARVQGTRLDDQRSELPRPKPKEVAPDDAFFNQLMRVQSGRMEDQRANIPLKSANSKK
ncbi:G-protein-signaling modulator 2 isoform 1 [Danaus plexippus plexippus]|uniref:G-protein-signaling modulator 2 isoform 1 n=1 Tax=Danaus plexippus plexippus TaxID=278856 RepID=A0A212EKB1_DANPL|nr:G-protein-signaling modulator 2 isoform 1 [Danaus plexippus plexippus]